MRSLNTRRRLDTPQRAVTPSLCSKPGHPIDRRGARLRLDQRCEAGCSVAGWFQSASLVPRRNGRRRMLTVFTGIGCGPCHRYGASSERASEPAGYGRWLHGVEFVGNARVLLERPSVIHYLCGPPPSEMKPVGGGARPACAIRGTRCWVQKCFRCEVNRIRVGIRGFGEWCRAGKAARLPRQIAGLTGCRANAKRSYGGHVASACIPQTYRVSRRCTGTARCRGLPVLHGDLRNFPRTAFG